MSNTVITIINERIREVLAKYGMYFTAGGMDREERHTVTGILRDNTMIGSLDFVYSAESCMKNVKISIDGLGTFSIEDGPDMEVDLRDMEEKLKRAYGDGQMDVKAFTAGINLWNEIDKTLRDHGITMVVGAEPGKSTLMAGNVEIGYTDMIYAGGGTKVPCVTLYETSNDDVMVSANFVIESETDLPKLDEWLGEKVGNSADPGMCVIRVQYLNDSVKHLQIEKKGDWIDLYAAETVELKQGEHKLIHLGVAMKLPEGYEAHLVPRSSTFKKWGIIQANHVGIIDNSYSGPEDWWKMPVIAMRDTVINKDDKICQFRIVERQPRIHFVEGKMTDPSRGGFGSTGSK